MPYVAGSLSDFVKLGPGKLYAAPVGSTEPSDLATALTTPWTTGFLGWTEEGHVFTITPSYENVEVAESLIPLLKIATGQDLVVEFALAEITAANVQKALNGATVTASGSGATAIDKVEPLAFGTPETRTALLWQADDGSERWFFRKCLQTGAVAIGRRKGAAKATIPLTFSLETVSSAIRPFGAILKSTVTIT
jgi:hypothetical protein